MIGYNLKDVVAAENLSRICEKYPELQIDCIRGRYTVDPRSVLGLVSIVGGFVGLEISADSMNKYPDRCAEFEKELVPFCY